MTDWKPGDVVVVTSPEGTSWRGIVRPRRGDAARSLEIAYVTGGFDMAGDLAEGYTTRPLVVIDPEDAEQVERLRVALNDRSFSAWACGANTVIAAALREFAAPPPPKPEEPQGLGAVVEDTVGYGWVSAIHDNRLRWWHPLQGGWSDYEDVSAVRVLSEGVTR